MISFALAFLFSATLLLIIFVLFSILNYKNRFHMKYDLRNHYPYELNYESKFNDNLTGNVAIIASSSFSIAFYCLFNNTYTNGFFLFVLIAGSIYSVILTSLVFISLKHLRMHLILVLFSIVLSFLIPFANAMGCAISFRNTNEAKMLIMTIINSIYCLFIFVLMMNPKLSRWAELKEEKNHDGTVKYVRPKVFILAFIEWALILSSPLLMVLTVVSKVVLG